MAEHRQAVEGKQNLKAQRARREPAVMTDKQNGSRDVAAFQQQVGNRAFQQLLGDHPEIAKHALRGELMDPAHLNVVTGLGQTNGNRQVQRMLAESEDNLQMLQRDPDDLPSGGFQLGSPELRLPRPEQPSLGVGSLQLDLAPFQQLNIENNFSPSRLFQPSPELMQQLVDNWLSQYRLVHQGPAYSESAWQQLWSAWRRLTDQWLARGADAPLNAEVAQDILSEQAAREVLNLPSRGGAQEVSLSDVAGRVWPAFQRALEATQFYPRIRQNAERLVLAHWPALIPTLGTALGVSLGMGLSGNDWTLMQRMSTLLPSLSQDINLSENWSMTIGFGESSPARGEQGVVLGVNPSIGFTYRGENVRFSVEGSVDLRFETGQGSTQGFRVHASPGLEAVLRW